ncbi:MAG: hypothetical protein J7K73_03260 [Nanoarchaeota archaeon]|nr:hypothetical protein [Nanoarchaeota archaeon]
MEKRPAIIGLGLRSVSDRYKQDAEISLIPTRWCGSNAIEHTIYKHQPNPSIGVGFVAALQEDLRKGDMILPSSSVSGGTIEEFFEADSIEDWMDNRENFEFKPDEELYNFIKEKLIELGYEVKTGRVFQVSGLQMEPNEVVEELHKRGYIGLEMETATYFASSKHQGTKAAAILTVSDRQYPISKREDINMGVVNKTFYPTVNLAIEILKEYLENGP